MTPSKDGRIRFTQPLRYGTGKSGVVYEPGPVLKKQKRIYTAGGGPYGLSVGKGTALGRVKAVALRTWGFKQVLWLRQQIDLDRSIMENARASYLYTWWELARWFSPRSPRFLESDVNYGWLRNEQIIDDTAGQAKDVLVAGMLSGISSPTRQWFKLAPKDRTLLDRQDVKDWCYDASKAMGQVFIGSNLYEELPAWYESAAVYGTGLMWMEESDDNLVRFQALPIGSYSISHDNEGRVNKFHRAFQMKAQQLLGKFGTRDSDGEITNWEVFSQSVRYAHDTDQGEQEFYIGHYVRPNDEYDPEAPGTKGFPFLEVYYEKGQVTANAPNTNTTAGTSEQWRFLRIRGLNRMPLMELIWKKHAEDDYGTECPGTRTLGVNKQLQAQEMRIAQAEEKMVNPPVLVPQNMGTKKVSLMPGGSTMTDMRGKDNGIRPVFEMKFDVESVGNHSAMLRGQINNGWFYDLFRAMQSLNEKKTQPVSATEIQEMKEEKLLMLSPVLEKVNLHGLKPLVEFTYDLMMMFKLLPPMPASMKGRDMSVEFTSIFSEALKALELQSIQGFVQDLTGYAQLQPGVMDNVDMDDLTILRADKGNVPSHIIRDPKERDAMRAQRAKVQAQQQKMAMQQQQAQTAQTASKASLNPADPSMLTQAMGM